MFVPRLFLASLAFTTMVASETKNDAGHADPVHVDAKAIEDEGEQTRSNIEIALHGSAQKKLEHPHTAPKSAVEMVVQPSGEVVEAPVQHQKQTEPAHTDETAIDEEDAESTTAIEVRPRVPYHGSDVPASEVFSAKLDQAPETPLQNKPRVATKKKGEADGMKHYSLHTSASPVLRNEMTPTASLDEDSGTVAVEKATLDGIEAEAKEINSPPVLRTSKAPAGSPAAPATVHWTYNTQQNKWVQGGGSADEVPRLSMSDISSIATTFNFYLQRNLSRWKKIIAQVEVPDRRIIHSSIIVIGLILAVCFSIFGFSGPKGSTSEKATEGSIKSKAIFHCTDEELKQEAAIKSKAIHARSEAKAIVRDVWGRSGDVLGRSGGIPNCTDAKPQKTALKNDDLISTNEKPQSGMPANQKTPLKNDDLISNAIHQQYGHLAKPNAKQDLRAMPIEKVEALLNQIEADAENKYCDDEVDARNKYCDDFIEKVEADARNQYCDDFIEKIEAEKRSKYCDDFIEKIEADATNKYFDDLIDNLEADDKI